LYWSRFAEDMTKRALSSGNGLSGRPLSALALVFLLFRPPAYSGMVPAALPAFSAPRGVNVVPSCSAFSGETFAETDSASSESVTAPAVVNNLFIIILSVINKTFRNLN